MAGANSHIQVTDLDFNTIKTNFKTFLQSQDVLKDYNYEGSVLSTLLDILAYNTQYNAYYLNMVANEMFLDSALLRSSVVSQAKILNYTPKSATAPSAVINLTINQVTDTSVTLPKFTTFMSSAIDGVNYNFVTTDSYTKNAVSGVVNFNNVTIKQGIPSSLSFTVDSTKNPTYTFEIPETMVDTSTITVTVQQTSSNTTLQIFELASNYLILNGTSKVYFLQESLTGTYQVYFGDGVLGQKLIDGNIVNISYIVTQGSASYGANNFKLMNTVAGYSNTVVTTVSSATKGSSKESIDSIKFQAPKSYSSQGRAVSKNDYITALQQNTLGISFDAVNVWGGEENNPPVYGQVFVAIKPSGGYFLTNTQKQRLISEVINPISVLTVTPTIVDPDYTYLQINANVYYDPTQTTLTSAQISSGVKTALQNYGLTNLNTFNSTFNSYAVLTAIQNYDPSIISSEFSLKLQKKFFPLLGNSSNIKLYYNTPIQPGKFGSGITSYPPMTFLDPSNLSVNIPNVYIEEVPQSTYGVESISIINPGYGYQSKPTITIQGDGTGATAEVVIINGSISSVVVTNSGNNYTQAIATVTPATSDTTGRLGALIVNLKGQYGTLRTYYNNANTNVKTILNTNIGTVDYQNGIISLNNFNPYGIDSALGQLAISVTPTTDIVSSTYDRIITIDQFDTTAITVNVTAKSKT
jgi:hypothetical protein